MSYERRYGKNWDQISDLTLTLTDHKCCFPGCSNKAIEAHHTIYFTNGEFLGDRCTPGIHSFGLCDFHHNNRKHKECAHHPLNWHRGTEEDKRDARNSKRYYKLLCQGFDQKINPLYRK